MNPVGNSILLNDFPVEVFVIGEMFVNRKHDSTYHAARKSQIIFSDFYSFNKMIINVISDPKDKEPKSEGNRNNRQARQKN